MYVNGLGAYDRITPFIVPSNAPAGMKMAAQRIRDVMAPKWVTLYGDYIPILDNTSDHVQVNDAIDLSAGRIDLGPGTITIGGGATTINLVSGLEIAGAGWNKTIIKAAASTTNNLLNVNAGGSIADIYLHDFQVDGNSANQTSNFALLGGTAQSTSRLIVERVWFKDAKNYGCIPENASNTELWFINCKFTDFTHADSLEAIVAGAARIFIVGCVFDNIDIDNMITINGSSGPATATDFMIIGNHFMNLGSTGAQCVAVWSTTNIKSLRGVIAGNTGTNNHNGFRVFGTASYEAGKVVIADNYMHGTGQATSWGGVWVDANTAFPVLVSGGVYDNFDSGLYSAGDDVEFNGVIVENCWQAGVTLVGNRCRLIGGRVRNSRRRNVGTANNVQVSGDNCEVRGVHISDTGTAQSVYGLDITAAADGTVYTDNTFTNAGATANVRDLGTNSVYHGNIGWKSENNLLSATFAIDSTGVKTVTTAHGLAITPAVEDIALTVVENTDVDDWAYNLLKVESVTSTNIVAKINVSTASGTGSATAKLAIRVGKP